jgi:hypothetical protein
LSGNVHVGGVTLEDGDGLPPELLEMVVAEIFGQLQNV